MRSNLRIARTDREQSTGFMRKSRSNGERILRTRVPRNRERDAVQPRDPPTSGASVRTRVPLGERDVIVLIRGGGKARESRAFAILDELVEKKFRASL